MTPLDVGNVLSSSLISFSDEGRAGVGCILEYFGKCPHLMSEMFPLNQLISFSDEGRAGVGCVLEVLRECPNVMSEMSPLNVGNVLT